jgi:hypothetical protein
MSSCAKGRFARPLLLYGALLLPATLTAKEPEVVVDPVLIDAQKSVSAQRLKTDDTTLVSFGTRNVYSEDQPHHGINAARDWIKMQFEEAAAHSGGRMSVSVDSWVEPANGKRISRDVTLSNVYAVLKGSEASSRTYVISGHYDTINSVNKDYSDSTYDAPGADDDGSGVMVVLAAARALATLQPRATIIFAAYSSEEQGLLGSAHHAGALKAAGIDVQGDLNNDIVGASVGPKGEKNPNTLRIFSEGLRNPDQPKYRSAGAENDSPSRELARYAREIGDKATPPMHGDMIYRADRYLRGGDHMSFNDADFAAIRFVEPVEDFAHQHQEVRLDNGVQYGDLLQYMDFDYLARVARYNIAVLGSLAMAPAAPRNAAIVVKKLSNDTELVWSPVSGAVRYQIVMRPTREPFWTDEFDAGSATSATVEISKDSTLFGVVAIDAEGHRSPAAFPSPKR